MYGCGSAALGDQGITQITQFALGWVHRKASHITCRKLILILTSSLALLNYCMILKQLKFSTNYLRNHKKQIHGSLFSRVSLGQMISRNNLFNLHFPLLTDDTKISRWWCLQLPKLHYSCHNLPSKTSKKSA